MWPGFTGWAPGWAARGPGSRLSPPEAARPWLGPSSGPRALMWENPWLETVEWAAWLVLLCPACASSCMKDRPGQGLRNLPAPQDSASRPFPTPAQTCSEGEEADLVLVLLQKCHDPLPHPLVPLVDELVAEVAVNLLGSHLLVRREGGVDEAGQLQRQDRGTLSAPGLGWPGLYANAPRQRSLSAPSVGYTFGLGFSSIPKTL